MDVRILTPAAQTTCGNRFLINMVNNNPAKPLSSNFASLEEDHQYAVLVEEEACQCAIKCGRAGQPHCVNQCRNKENSTTSGGRSNDIEELKEICLHEEPDEKVDETYIYYNMVAFNERKISLDKLEEYVKNRTDTDFMEEFESLPTGLIKPCIEALRKENKLKNRYQGIYPYDETRVTIGSKPDDYINASYIDGYNQNRAYIACIGPTEKFMGDLSIFWRVVWKECCSTIVMLTRLVETEVIKCDKYWPDKDDSKDFGNISVTCIGERNYQSHIIRTFKIDNKKKYLPRTRVVQQFHYTDWPDSGVPEHAYSLLEFRSAVNQSRSKATGPLLVHCSAGVGRSGTYIALDKLTKEGEAESRVDIYACVRNLREQRVKMVQTVEQYRFLHQALVHSLCKTTFNKDMLISTRL